MPTYRYAGYPTAQLYPTHTAKKGVKELLWGDWVKVTGSEKSGRVPVRARGEDGWMNTEDLQEERLLEIVFVDVGQGDGCLVVTPNDEHHVIDAGVSDNMYRYLKWRYAGFKRKWTFASATITHPDQDHYLGFKKLFEEENVSFEAVYHNGIMEERDERNPLGPSQKIGGRKYLTGLIESPAELRAFLRQKERWQHPTRRQYNKRYPTLLHTALHSGRVEDIRMLSDAHCDDGYLPRYGEDKELCIRVLGPVVETDDGQRSLLRWLGSKGETKNGHSVLYLLKYRHLRVFLGGDLNSASQNYLLAQYTGLESPAKSGEEEQVLVSAARDTFEVDVAKGCHHGSADFEDAFLSVLNAAATVVSSGDEESHAHPRSDTLGALGQHGRGWRSLLFSTELVRSVKERDPELIELLVLLDELGKASSDTQRERLREKIAKQKEKVSERNVTVYGSINLRSDGRKAVLAYRLERERATRTRAVRWDAYRLERVGGGPFVFPMVRH